MSQPLNWLPLNYLIKKLVNPKLSPQVFNLDIFQILKNLNFWVTIELTFGSLLKSYFRVFLSSASCMVENELLRDW